jgi:hypothetical protein
VTVKPPPETTICGVGGEPAAAMPVMNIVCRTL